MSELPFQSQPKDQKARIEGVNKKRKIDKAVISEPGEQKVKKLLNILGHEKNARDQKRKDASKIRAENYRKELIFIWSPYFILPISSNRDHKMVLNSTLVQVLRAYKYLSLIRKY